jgi:hypothetical protein
MIAPVFFMHTFNESLKNKKGILKCRAINFLLFKMPLLHGWIKTMFKKGLTGLKQ